MTFSPTFHAFRGAGVPADGRDVRWAVTLGNDVHQPDWGNRVPVHETGHLFGLPDLYDVGSPAYPNLLRFVGGWDVMSWVQTGAHFFRVEQAALGVARTEPASVPQHSGPTRCDARTDGDSRRREGRRGQDRRVGRDGG